MKKQLLFIGFLICSVASANELIPDFEENSVPVLNEELRRIQSTLEFRGDGYLFLPIQSAKLPTSNPARIDAAENNWRLLFDATTDQSCLWQGVVPNDYNSDPSLTIFYTMNSATSGSVRFEAKVMALTPGDLADINTDSYDSTNSIGDTVPGTAGYLASFTLPLTSSDQIQRGDLFKVKINRDANGTTGTDDASGDCEIVGVILNWKKR